MIIKCSAQSKIKEVQINFFLNSLYKERRARPPHEHIIHIQYIYN
jgi:hypothetical protein